MEHCFIVALGMLFLVGYLQAAPFTTLPTLPTIIINDLNIEETSENVKCGADVTFISPTNVEERCYAAAMKTFKTGLIDAKEKCNITSTYIDDTYETVNSTVNSLTGLGNSTEPNCGWKSRKEFRVFLKDLESLAQRINAK